MPEIELPDGRIVEIPYDATPEQLDALRTKLRQEFPDAGTQAGAAQESSLTPSQREFAERTGLMQPTRRPNAVKPPENIAEEFALSTEGTLRGAGRGFFGVGDQVLAANEAAAGTLENLGRRATGRETRDFGGFQGALERQRQRTEDVAERVPVATGAGTVAGALAPVPGAQAGLVARAAQGDRIARALVLTKGEPLKNVLRTAGIGGASGAVTEANLGGDAEDIKEAGAVGAVLGPVLGAGGRVAGSAFNLARSAVDKYGQAGVEALARGLKGVNISPAELRRRAKEFYDATGRGATLAEILEPGGAQELRAATSRGFRGQRARETMQEFAEQRRVGAQEDVAKGIQNKKVVVSEPRIDARRKRAFDRFMGANSERPVELTGEEAETLLEEAGRLLPPKARENVVDQMGQEGADAVRITLRDADNIRQALNKASEARGEALRFRQIADVIREIATESVPKYDEALKAFALRSRAGEGVVKGGGIRTADETDFVQSADELRRSARGGDLGATAELAGRRVGIRKGLTDTARKSPEQARQVAAELAESSGLQRKLRDIDPAEAERLERMARTELNALNSVREAVRGTKIGNALDDELKDVQSALELGSLAQNRFSAGFLISSVMRTLRRLGVPPTAAERLARASTDPAKTGEVITMLERAGIEPTAAQKFARAIARTGGRLSAPAIAEDG